MRRLMSFKWAALGLLLLLAFLYWQNNGLVISRYTYTGSRIPAGFDGYTIVQVSDLHGKRFGRGQQRLLAAIREARPDLIVMTGDLTDRRRYRAEPALELVRGAAQIAPVYAVSGNHEAWGGQYDAFGAQLTRAGARVLDDQAAAVSSNGDEILLLGLRDPAFFTDRGAGQTALTQTERQLAAWAKLDGCKVLLSHRPELLKLYAKAGMDIAFSGHAHGGQFRLPGLGGLYAPHQGFFPAYSEGACAAPPTTMFVSRGLGNSLFPQRLFNRPELVVVTLQAASR